MKKILAVAALAGVSLLGVSAPAEAASKQTYCNGSFSAKSFKVGSTSISPGSCKKLSKSAIVHLGGGSYQVKYNSGAWSGCRTNDNFNAYDAPSKITFAVAYSKTCQDWVY